MPLGGNLRVCRCQTIVFTGQNIGTVGASVVFLDPCSYFCFPLFRTRLTNPPRLERRAWNIPVRSEFVFTVMPLFGKVGVECRQTVGMTSFFIGAERTSLTPKRSFKHRFRPNMVGSVFALPFNSAVTSSTDPFYRYFVSCRILRCKMRMTNEY